MNRKKVVLSFILTSLVFFCIDILWLGMIGREIYQSYLGHLMAKETNWIAALIFYLLYISGIFHFAIIPGIKIDSSKSALLNGALFGFFCYSTFELTALAVLNEWPIGIVPIDILWGIFLTSSVSLAGFKILKGLKI